MKNFVCSRDCPESRYCLSMRDYPCSVYMAVKKRRIDSNGIKREVRARDRKVTYRALKRIYESEDEQCQEYEKCRQRHTTG